MAPEEVKRLLQTFQGDERPPGVPTIFDVNARFESISCRMVKSARDNARGVRIGLTREVWEATNESWMTLDKLLTGKIPEADLPDTLTTIRQQNALVRGASCVPSVPTPLPTSIGTRSGGGAGGLTSSSGSAGGGLNFFILIG